MAPTIPSTPPASFRAGDTVKFTVEHADYSATDGWAILYTVNGPVKKTGISVSSGTSTTVTLSAANSAALTPGTYTWQITATKDGERYTVAAGVVSVTPDISTATTLQSQDEKELGYLNAEIGARAQSDHTEYVIEGRSLKREPLVELLEWRDKLRARIKRRRQGGALSTVAVHFGSRSTS